MKKTTIISIRSDHGSEFEDLRNFVMRMTLTIIFQSLGHLNKIKL